MTRVIYTCRKINYKPKEKACDNVWAIDYNECTDSTLHNLRKWYRVDSSGDKIRPGDWIDRKCPKCGTVGARFKEVVGTYSAGHRCDDRCIHARGHSCRCQCGGESHGRGRLVCEISKDDASEILGAGTEAPTAPDDLFAFVPPAREETAPDEHALDIEKIFDW